MQLYILTITPIILMFIETSICLKRVSDTSYFGKKCEICNDLIIIIN